MNKMNSLGQEVVPCMYCEADTTMLGTKKCDGCWELSHIRMETPEVIVKIIKGELSDENINRVIELLKES